MGQHIRDQIKVAFAKGEISQTQSDKAQCDRYYASLKRLASNQYAIQYPRILNSTASGLTAEQCNLALSPELQDYFLEDDLSLAQKLVRKFKKPELKDHNGQALSDAH